MEFIFNKWHGFFILLFIVFIALFLFGISFEEENSGTYSELEENIGKTLWGVLVWGCLLACIICLLIGIGKNIFSEN